MGIRHPFVSSVIDIGGPTYVQPTHWNQQHTSPPETLAIFSSPLNVTPSFGVPSTAGATGFDYPNNTPILRLAYDFTNFDMVQLGVGIASTFSLGSTALRLQYAPSGFPASWYSFDATGGSAPFVSLASGNNASMYLLGSNGQMVGPTSAISAAAKALPQPLNCRLAGYGGNGSGIALANIVIFGL